MHILQPGLSHPDSSNTCLDFLLDDFLQSSISHFTYDTTE